MAGQWKVRGKTFLITGGAAGIGAMLVENFLKQEAKYVVFVDISEEQGKAAETRLKEAYPRRVTFIKCDVSDEASISSTFDTVINKVKQLDVIFNNAGLMIDSPALWRKTCDVNVQGLISLTMKGVTHMRKDDGGAGGTIINVASTAAFHVIPVMPIYSATKAAVLHFSQCLSAGNFFEKTGVRVLTVCFGATNTALVQGFEQRLYDPRLLNHKKVAKIRPQTLESAAAACLQMYTTADPGTVWLSHADKPAEDITKKVKAAYDALSAIHRLKDRRITAKL